MEENQEYIGLPTDVWRKTLDKYLITEKIESDLYLNMNDAQTYVIQELKKSFKRIKSNQDKLCQNIIVKSTELKES